MKSIKNEVNNEIVIKNSKFITIISKVYNENDVEETLDNIKKKYKDATHYCYAYIIDNIKRFSDDNEPSKTAGMPIMEVLSKNNLNYVLGVVVRYYGGIKLGAGGLIRAYANSIKEALNKGTIVDLIKGKRVEITFDYDNTLEINYILNESFIEEKEYGEKVKCIVKIREDKYNSVLSELNRVGNVKVMQLEDIYIEVDGSN
jgi:uncharacterized YigZ family protein